MPATRVWNSLGSTDMNDPANYSGAGPLAPDDIQFDNTSVVDAIATADFPCHSLTIVNTYTGLWSDGGFNFTIASTVQIDISNTLPYASWPSFTGTWTQTGDADFIMSAPWASTMITLMNIDMQGSGVFHVHWPPNNVTLAYPGKTINSTDMRVEGALTINGGIFNGIIWVITTTQTTPLVIVPGSVLGVNVAIISFWGVAPLSISVPPLHVSDHIILENQGYAVGTFDMQGALYAGQYIQFLDTGTHPEIVNTNDYAITCIADGLYLAGENLICGASALDIGVLYCYSGAVITAQTSTWTVHGAVFQGGTFIAGTSHVTMVGTTALYSQGQSFYDLTLNANVTLHDLLDVLHDFNISGGAFNDGGFGASFAGDATFGGAGNLTISGSLLFSGAAAHVVVSTSGVKTLTGSIWTFTGAAPTLDLCADSAIAVGELITNTAAQVITWTPQGVRKVAIAAYTAGDWGAVTWVSSAPGTPYYISAPAGAFPGAMSVTDCYNAGFMIVALNVTDGGGNTGWQFVSTLLTAGAWRPGQARGPFVGGP